MTGLGALARACMLGALCLPGLAGQAEAARFALLVGNNQGQGADAPLRFSENDTVRLAELLTRLGGFAPGGTVVLVGRSADEVRRALADLAARLRAAPGEHLALVYYSGHADAQTLHMRGASFALAELRDTLKTLPAATRVLIVDACQAGVLTRAKGARAGAAAAFEITAGAVEDAQGLAVLASSAASELAQESDALGGSVFTHYLRTGLAGLADRNGDGNVSLSEVFEFTSARTLAATLGTSTGPQHPTFRFDLTGRDDLVLTRPGLSGAGYGHLRLDVPGWYFVRRRDGTIAAELVSRGSETLALEPGPYEVTRRERRSLDVASVDIGERAATAISRAPTRAVAFGRMVRKGEGPRAAYGLVMTATLRTPLENLGPSLGAAAAGRVELSAASVEVRLGLGRAQRDSARLSSSVWDASASATLLRPYDVGPVTWAFGLGLGASYMVQQVDDGSRRAALSPFAGPLALADVPLGRRFFFRAEVGAPLYALRVQTNGAGQTRWRAALVSAAGVGTSF